MTAGAPLRKSSPAPFGASGDKTTAPDLRVSELNSSTFTMDSLAILKADNASDFLGRTTASLSCTISNQPITCLVCEVQQRDLITILEQNCLVTRYDCLHFIACS